VTFDAVTNLRNAPCGSVIYRSSAIGETMVVLGGPVSSTCDSYEWYNLRTSSGTSVWVSQGPTSSSWYAYSGTVDPCLQWNDCADCASALGCGWCPGTSTCETGTNSGPATGSCTGDWVTGPGSCPAPDPCNAQHTCGDCTAQDKCGWCGDTNTCSTGTANAPAGCVAWSWTPADCATGGLTGCSEETSCVVCSSLTGCGWCPGTNTCAGGTATSSSNACTPFNFYPSSCAAVNGSSISVSSDTKRTKYADMLSGSVKTAPVLITLAVVATAALALVGF